MGNRIPDQETLQDIVQNLNISYYALAEPSLSENYGAMHALFRMEKIYGLKPVEIDERILLEVEEASGAIFNQTLCNWHDVYQKYKDGKIDREIYLKWQAQYPEQLSPDAPSIPVKQNTKRMRKLKVK